LKQDFVFNRVGYEPLEGSLKEGESRFEGIGHASNQNAGLKHLVGIVVRNAFIATRRIFVGVKKIEVGEAERSNQ
jgi:hypothetical protein